MMGIISQVPFQQETQKRAGEKNLNLKSQTQELLEKGVHLSILEINNAYTFPFKAYMMNIQDKFVRQKKTSLFSSMFF